VQIVYPNVLKACTGLLTQSLWRVNSVFGRLVVWPPTFRSSVATPLLRKSTRFHDKKH